MNEKDAGGTKLPIPDANSRLKNPHFFPPKKTRLPFYTNEDCDITEMFCQTDENHRNSAASLYFFIESD